MDIHLDVLQYTIDRFKSENPFFPVRNIDDTKKKRIKEYFIALGQRGAVHTIEMQKIPGEETKISGKPLLEFITDLQNLFFGEQKNMDNKADSTKK